ncbi:MAG TPA: phospholipase C, phosphocholine-specific, partial [Stenotrophomonas maltophilia]|nr:phospholipase C, phosphocholine-specific [Stenotrophomonas maltophilia]
YQDMADNFTDNPLAGFEVFRQAHRAAPGHDPQLRARGVSTRGLAQLRQDVIGGRLPQVSFIIADAAGSEHPGPSSPAQGAAYTARVLDALTADPEVW